LITISFAGKQCVTVGVQSNTLGGGVDLESRAESMKIQQQTEQSVQDVDLVKFSFLLSLQQQENISL